jgi:hypothetical protein
MFNISTLGCHADEEGDRLLGPSCLPPYLTGAAYRDFLPQLLQDADLQARSPWFMHDGVSPHFLLAFREFLSNVFLEQWMGRG